MFPTFCQKAQLYCRSFYTELFSQSNLSAENSDQGHTKSQRGRQGKLILANDMTGEGIEPFHACVLEQTIRAESLILKS